MIRRSFLAALALVAAASVSSGALAAPGLVNVSMKTSVGTFVLAIDVRHAPITGKNFLAYVDQKKFDGTIFYRAARAQGNDKRGFIQGGVHRDATRSLLPIAHEPTTKTGIHHVDGTISMARQEPGTAMGEFFILVGDAPSMDAKPGGKGDAAGYAAFGHVVSGMSVVKKILASKTWLTGGGGAMKNQLIKDPVKILAVKRL